MGVVQMSDMCLLKYKNDVRRLTDYHSACIRSVDNLEVLLKSFLIYQDDSDSFAIKKMLFKIKSIFTKKNKKYKEKYLHEKEVLLNERFDKLMIERQKLIEADNELCKKIVDCIDSLEEFDEDDIVSLDRQSTIEYILLSDAETYLYKDINKLTRKRTKLIKKLGGLR